MLAPPGLSQPYAFAHGWPELVYGAQPAAAAGFTLTNPGRLGWRLVGACFRFVTDANAANRYLSVDYNDGNGLYAARNPFPQAVTLSTTAEMSFQADRGSADWNANNFAAVPLQAFFFSPGQKLEINVTNAQAGDQLSRIVLVFERFPDEPGEYPAALRRD